MGSYWREKVAIVTGGSAGLGRAIAAEFAAGGARVVIAARGAEKLETAAQQLRDAGGDVTAIATDMLQQTDVDRLVEQTISHYGQIDALVNNVGRSTRGKILDTTVDDFQQLWDMNFLTAVRATRTAAPHLLQSGGHVINIGSLAAKCATRYLGAYPASKFALAAYSQQLRLEHGPDGLHVLFVCPGPIRRDDAGSRYADESTDVPVSAQQPGGGAKLSAIAPETLARKILIASEQGKLELVIPTKVRLLSAIGQLWPTLGDRIIRRST